MPRSSHEEFYAQSSLPVALHSAILIPAQSSLPDALHSAILIYARSSLPDALHSAILIYAQSSMQMVRLNPARSSQSKFQETIVPRVSRVPHVPLRHRQSAKLLADGVAKSCAKLRKQISRNHRPTRLARPTRPTSLSAKREAQSLALHCNLQSAKLCEMGLCAPCRGAPAVVLRFSCQRSNWLIPLPLSKCASTPSQRA